MLFHIIKLLGKRLAAGGTEEVPQIQVRHILIRTDALTSEAQAIAKLNTLKSEILSGKTTFEKAAKTYSNDLASSAKGGELGWVTSDKLVPEFSEKIQDLAENKISEPFKTPFGWHIVEVLGRRTSTAPETKLRQKAHQLLQKRKFEERLEAWQRQLRDESYVKILLPGSTG